tara:strand:- start:314 stop:2761 length:2448 start_codon:yes stop_codon:yes gene_type:complete
MKNIYFVITFLILTISSNAQSISGKIIDEETKEELIGVNVILNNNGEGTATDVFGKYNLNISKGKYIITYKYIGYKEQTVNLNIQDLENKIINISLLKDVKELSTVVISAGRFEQKIEEITVSMEVIKPNLIENKNTTDIQTAMDQVPGVNITDGQANIRGGSGWSYGAGTRVLVMVDDMPLISGDAGQVQWKLIATENINQVEVIKGASSALYGSSALNGVINIRTAFPSQKDIDKYRALPGYTKINTHFGLIDKPKREILNWNGEKRRAFKGIEFLHSMKINMLDLSLGGNIFKDDGYRFGEVTDRKRFNINSNYKSKKIKGLSFGINSNFLFQSTGSVLIWESLDKAYIPLGGEVTTTNGDTYNIDPFITYFKNNNRHSLRTRYLKVINDNSTKGEDVNQDNESEIFYSDYQWQKRIPKYKTTFTIGTTNELVFSRSELFNGNTNRLNNSIYSQIDKKYKKLTFSIGSRFERFELNTDKIYVINGDSTNSISTQRPIFRTGLNYELTKHTFIRSSWGQGYRFPSLAELFITANQSGIEIYPNPELKPESGWSSEIGIKQGVKFNSWMGYIDVAAFLMQYNDMMEFSFNQWGPPDPNKLYGNGFKSVNVGKTQINGVEISVTGQGKINNNTSINILAGYTYMNHKSLSPNEIYAYGYNHGYQYIDIDINSPTYLDTIIINQAITYNNSSSDSTLLKYRYNHIAKIDFEITHKKINLGGSLRYNDFMQNIDEVFTSSLINEGLPGLFDGIPGINDARDKFSNGDLIIDSRIGYQINNIFKLGFVINNLLNTEYMSRPANMMPPRTYAFQFNMKI